MLLLRSDIATDHRSQVHHQQDIGQHLQVPERIAGNDQDIGHLAHLQGAQEGIAAADVGRIPGGGDDDLHGRHARLQHVADLPHRHTEV